MKLTPLQDRIIAGLDGKPRSVAEIAERIGYRNRSLQGALFRLSDRNLIDRDGWDFFKRDAGQ